MGEDIYWIPLIALQKRSFSSQLHSTVEVSIGWFEGKLSIPSIIETHAGEGNNSRAIVE